MRSVLGREVKVFLGKTVFETIIEVAPLISIDLVVRNASGQVLLGMRTNRPDQGYWFVPGGRIYKNESLGEAFNRLTKMELGIELSICDAKYLGLYEHFYEDCVFDLPSSGKQNSTHYVINRFGIVLPSHITELPKDQHEEYRWLSEADLLAADDVHLYSKWYFDKDKGFL